MASADAASDERASARRAAAALMYRSHVDAVWGYVARRLGSDLASDVVAETFRIAIENLDHFPPGTVRSRLHRIRAELRAHIRRPTTRSTHDE